MSMFLEVIAAVSNECRKRAGHPAPEWDDDQLVYVDAADALDDLYDMLVDMNGVS